MKLDKWDILLIRECKRTPRTRIQRLRRIWQLRNKIDEEWGASYDQWIVTHLLTLLQELGLMDLKDFSNDLMKEDFFFGFRPKTYNKTLTRMFSIAVSKFRTANGDDLPGYKSSKAVIKHFGNMKSEIVK